MKLEELKELIESGAIEASVENYIESGNLIKSNNDEVPYLIHCGWDPVLAHRCNREWAESNIELFEDIENQIDDDNERKKVLESIIYQDSHWDYVLKSIHFKSNSYDWFFLISDSKIQGVCITFHPKDSLLDKNEIFYIEYVSVAPWNRKNLFCDRVFKSVGTKLVKCAQSYAVATHKLSYGFSLHSLPQANGYYEHLGMKAIVGHEKGPMNYYEMPKEKAELMVVC